MASEQARHRGRDLIWEARFALLEHEPAALVKSNSIASSVHRPGARRDRLGFEAFEVRRSAAGDRGLTSL